MKKSLATLFTGLLLPTLSIAYPYRVVIDPGHGGSDEGTVHHGRYGQRVGKVTEKEVTLQLARLVAYELRLRGMMATLTRDDDQEIPLAARTALANRLGANLFISIHMNSTESGAARDAEGIETYILNNATDASSRRLASLENSVITSPTTPAPVQHDVALILKDLRLDGNLTESKRLACYVQNNLVENTSKLTAHPGRNRGIKQSLFHVLLGADMPSILVEAGFLSNANDRALVLSRKGQSSISRAIADAVSRFQKTKAPCRVPHIAFSELKKSVF